MGEEKTGLNLEELEALHKAATPGPWAVGRSYESIFSNDEVVHDERGDRPDYGGILICESLFGPGDRALIIAMHAALPELLRLARIGQEVERLIASGYDGPMMGDAVAPLMRVATGGNYA